MEVKTKMTYDEFESWANECYDSVQMYEDAEGGEKMSYWDDDEVFKSQEDVDFTLEDEDKEHWLRYQKENL